MPNSGEEPNIIALRRVRRIAGSGAGAGEGCRATASGGGAGGRCRVNDAEACRRHRRAAVRGGSLSRRSVFAQMAHCQLVVGGGIEEFLADVDGFTADFAAFLPDALAFARTWRGDRPM